MRIESDERSFDLFKTPEGLFGVYDSDGEVLYFDKTQASQLIIVLQNAIRTGEVPE